MDVLASLDAAESLFQSAFAGNDLATLDRLLDPNVRFVGPDGTTIGKIEDLAAHSSGQLVIDGVKELHREVQVIAGIGITRAMLHLVGTAGGNPLVADLVYTRVWRPVHDEWIIVAAHGTAV